MSGKLFQAIIESGNENLIVAEVVATDDDQAFEMINSRLLNYGRLLVRKFWLESGGLLVSVGSEKFQKRTREAGRTKLRGSFNGKRGTQQQAK